MVGLNTYHANCFGHPFESNFVPVLFYVLSKTLIIPLVFIPQTVSILIYFVQGPNDHLLCTELW